MPATYRCVLYIPADPHPKPDRPDPQARWRDRVLAAYARIAGGATADATSTGAWIDARGQLCTEPIVRVYALARPDVAPRLRRATLALARRIAADLSQEAVAVEINHRFLLVSPSIITTH